MKKRKRTRKTTMMMKKMNLLVKLMSDENAQRLICKLNCLKAIEVFDLIVMVVEADLSWERMSN